MVFFATALPITDVEPQLPPDDVQKDCVLEFIFTSNSLSSCLPRAVGGSCPRIYCASVQNKMSLFGWSAFDAANFYRNAKEQASQTMTTIMERTSETRTLVSERSVPIIDALRDRSAPIAEHARGTAVSLGETFKRTAGPQTASQVRGLLAGGSVTQRGQLRQQALGTLGDVEWADVTVILKERQLNIFNGWDAMDSDSPDKVIPMDEVCGVQPPDESSDEEASKVSMPSPLQKPHIPRLSRRAAQCCGELLAVTGSILSINVG